MEMFWQWEIYTPRFCGKKTLRVTAVAAGEERNQDMWQRWPCRPRSVKTEAEEVIQALEQRLPCSLWRRPQWDQLCPCSPWRSRGGRDPHPACGEPHTRGSRCSKRIATLWETCAGAVFWQDLLTNGRRESLNALIRLTLP